MTTDNNPFRILERPFERMQCQFEASAEVAADWFERHREGRASSRADPPLPSLLRRAVAKRHQV